VHTVSADQSVRVDTVVIGAGPMGASAARHLSMDPAAGRVLVIGPEEPLDHHALPPQAGGAFGAWHDEARLTRIVANDDVWATLAEESIDRYPQIAAEGGLAFHEPRGVLYVHEARPSFDLQMEVASRHRAVFTDVSHEPERFGYFRLPAGGGLILEGGGAGVINPRRLVANQLVAAEARGATVLRDVATVVDTAAGGVVVHTRGGLRVEAERVLVAAGGYLNSFGFFAEPLPVTSIGITALFFEVDGQAAAALEHMPGMLWYPDDPHAHFLYSVPPTRYPDGRTYFKIGGVRESGPLAGNDAIDEWYRTDGGRLEADALREWISVHLPLLAGKDRHSVGCVITEVASGFPLVHEVVPQCVVVASGCAGAAAKSCDEIGRLAAVLTAHGTWDSSLPQALFGP
jgi:sarcosine oxidase